MNTLHNRQFSKVCLAVASILLTASASAHDPKDEDIEVVTIEGRQTSLFGEAISASEGIVSGEEISKRPLLRTGEVLELVPGMVVTQHSGSGKANQYFLRGFNLDHGTDFATFIDGMPINLRTHGHGQGYTDLNFIIPETVNTLRYKKGAYYAEVGDFSGAGAAHMSTLTQSANSRVSLTLGEYGYARGLILQDIALDDANLIYAIEHQIYDGPWTDIEEDVGKTNVFAKYQQPLAGGKFALSFMGYDNDWNSADQIPQRAVEQGLIDEFGSIDPTLGGQSSRYSLNAQWQKDDLSVSAYVIDSDFTLYSNFTYFLDNDDTGDQFTQVDKRRIFGGEVTKTFFSRINHHDMSNQFGLQYRFDDIDEVGLFSSRQRQSLGAVRFDQVEQSSYSLFWENQYGWTERLRSKFGVRYDFYDFDVDSRVNTNVNGIDLSGNNGTEDDGLVSVKGSLIYTVNDNIEAYVSAGEGFHSNDARGTIASVDPVSGETIAPVDPLVSSFGYEVGLKANIDKRLNASIALWTLELDSELLFVGDAGNTEASGASTRDGVEVTIYYRPSDAWIMNLEYAYTDSEFDDEPSSANAIPGAIDRVIQSGVTYQQPNWFASAQLRYFGERPLVEDRSAVSDSSTLFNVRVGYEISEQLRLTVDVLNLLDSDDHDIDYFYESRLASETVPVEDVHYHILQPRALRVGLEYQF